MNWTERQLTETIKKDPVGDQQLKIYPFSIPFNKNVFV